MDPQIIWKFLFEPIDLYCERTHRGLWAEPFNALSNAAFLLGALGLYRLAGRVDKEPARKALVYLSVMSALVGAGSALFHSFPNKLTQSADVLPIAIFVALAVYFYFRERADHGIPLRQTLILCLLFITGTPLLAILLGLSPYFAKGEYYLGLFPAMLLLAVSETNHAKRMRIFLSALIFGLALTARTLDPYLCADFPLGSHFIWHLGSAAAAFLMGTVQGLNDAKRTTAH
ncbi:hypothetical protein EPO44_03095 [bacterium]|nr:MAG: hypothetical protein EPO44_03095 [bacterium]